MFYVETVGDIRLAWKLVAIVPIVHLTLSIVSNPYLGTIVIFEKEALVIPLFSKCIGTFGVGIYSRIY